MAENGISLRVHEQLKELYESYDEVFARWGPRTQPELASVLSLIETGLEHDRHGLRWRHLGRVRGESILGRRSEVGLAGSLHLVWPRPHHFEVKAALEEVGNLSKYLGDRDVGGCRVLEYGVNFVEIGTLECDIIPVSLERLLRNLLHILDKLVCVNGKFYLEAVLLRLCRTALARNEELGRSQRGLANHAHDDNLGRLARLVTHRATLHLIVGYGERIHDLHVDVRDLSHWVLALESQHQSYKVPDRLSLTRDFKIVVAVQHALFDTEGHLSLPEAAVLAIDHREATLLRHADGLLRGEVLRVRTFEPVLERRYAAFASA